MAALDERRRDRLHETGRAADERALIGLGAPPDLGEHLAVHPPAVALPIVWLLSGQGEERFEPVASPRKLVELGAVNQVLRRFAE